MKTHSMVQPPEEPEVFAAYVASLTGELARLSRENGMVTLGYILEMARLEARNIAIKGQDEKQTPASSLSNTASSAS